MKLTQINTNEQKLTFRNASPKRVDAGFSKFSLQNFEYVHEVQKRNRRMDMDRTQRLQHDGRGENELHKDCFKS